MKKIAIIDDDQHIGDMLSELLIREGYQVQRAYSGTEALLLLSDTKPDLILLDLMLREKDGFTLLREWKQRQRTKDVPVIIISARGAERDKVRGLELGAKGYVTKPIGVRTAGAHDRVGLMPLGACDDMQTLQCSYPLSLVG